MKIVIEGKPIPKARPRFSHGRTYTPQPTLDYESRIRNMAIQQMQGKPPTDEPLAMQVDMYFPIPASWTKAKRLAAQTGRLPHTSKPDATNVMKSIEDALNGIAYTDDRQIVTTTGRKHYSTEPRIEVTLAPISQAERI